MFLMTNTPIDVRFAAQHLFPRANNFRIVFT